MGGKLARCAGSACIVCMRLLPILGVANAHGNSTLLIVFHVASFRVADVQQSSLMYGIYDTRSLSYVAAFSDSNAAPAYTLDKPVAGSPLHCVCTALVYLRAAKGVRVDLSSSPVRRR